MKPFLLLTVLIFSTTAMAFEDKCYEIAKLAAFEFVKEDEQISKMSEFEDIYDNEHVEISIQNGWQKEFWSFYNLSGIVNVEIHLVKGKCYVKNLDLSQNDQD